MENSGCKKCNRKTGIPAYQTWSLILGGYIFLTSIYGTVELVKKLIHLLP
jgi:hypothetical protein